MGRLSVGQGEGEGCYHESCAAEIESLTFFFSPCSMGEAKKYRRNRQRANASMKRSLITTLVVGVAVAIVVGVLHATKVLAGFEAGCCAACFRLCRATRVVGQSGSTFCLAGSFWCCLAQPEKSPGCGRSRNYLLFGLFFG